MQFSSQVTSVTREYIVPNVFSQINLSSVLAVLLLAEGSEWTSGTRFELPIKYALSTNGGNTGIADQLDSDRQTNRTRMQFNPYRTYKPVVIATIEQHLNRGDERVVDMLSAEIHSQTQDLMEFWADQVFGGSGAGDEWVGVQVAADDATNFASYGALSRTTYPALDGYYLASTGSLTLAKMATAYDATEKGQDSATIIPTTKALWSAYEALNTPTVHANYTAMGSDMVSISPDGMVVSRGGLSGGQGFRALTYRGTPVVKDEHCPNGKMFLLNTRKNGSFRNLGLAAIDESGESMFGKINFENEGGDPKGTFGSRKAPKGFAFRELQMPANQLANVGYVLIEGTIAAGEPRLQGQMTGVTA